MRNAAIAALFVAALACACAPNVPRPAVAPTAVPDAFPEDYYRQAAARGEPVFRVEPTGSVIVIEVRRAGRLAHLGHDHVVASHDVQGLIAPGQVRADLFVRLEQLAVDEQSLRDEAGFDTSVSEDDIAATRRNMLGRVLHIDQHPYVLIAVRGAESDRPLKIEITLNGVTRAIDVPVDLQTSAEQLAVSGRLSLAQTDFGITPFSILNGAIQVRDEVNVRFAVRARRAPGYNVLRESAPDAESTAAGADSLARAIALSRYSVFRNATRSLFSSSLRPIPNRSS